MPLVTCVITDGIAQVRLNRPEKLNALTLPLLRELVSTAKDLRKDKTLRWERSEPSLEDVFIGLMSTAKDNFQ